MVQRTLLMGEERIPLSACGISMTSREPISTKQDMTPQKKGQETIALGTKQKVLQLLGGHADSTFGESHISEPTKEAPPPFVARQLNVPRSAIYQRNSTCEDILQTLARLAKKRKVIRAGDYTLIKKSLRMYMIRTINLMNEISLFCGDIIRRVALEIHERTMKELEKKIEVADGVVHEKLISERQPLVEI